MKQRPLDQSEQIRAIYKEMADTPRQTPKLEERRLKNLRSSLEAIPLTSETLPAWKKYYLSAQAEHEACPPRCDIFRDVLVQKVKEIDPDDIGFINKFRQTFGAKLSNTFYWTARPEAKPKPPKKAQAT